MAKKKSERRFDAAGWLFWLITFGVFLPFSLYGSFSSWGFLREKASVLAKVILAVVVAAIVAGILSVTVNAVLQFFNKRRRLAERKKVRKNG